MPGPTAALAAKNSTTQAAKITSRRSRNWRFTAAQVIGSSARVAGASGAGLPRAMKPRQASAGSASAAATMKTEAGAR